MGGVLHAFRVSGPESKAKLIGLGSECQNRSIQNLRSLLGT